MFDDRQITMNERKYRETTALLNKNLELRVTDREQLEQLLAAVNREIESILAALARLDRATTV